MDIKRVLVAGSGGREHALCWKIARSPRVEKVFCAPGNAGIAAEAECVPIKASDIDGLVRFVRDNHVDLTVIGPEDPLAMGIVDRFREEGLVVFGPGADAARIEASKVFTKELLSGAGIPTGAYRVFSDPDDAMAYIRDSAGVPVAIKADGLAAGKGVILAHTLEEAEEAINLIMKDRAFGNAGDKVVIEEFLTGEEASFMAVTDGKTVLPLATSQDHKPVFDGDRGPNTGGMGAYSPAPVVTEKLHEEIMETIIEPTVRAMEEAGSPYTGILYGGLIIRDGKARVIEYNCRFGDPEAQPILMRLRTDLVDIIEAAIEGRLDRISLEWDERAAVCVVLASDGYPGSYEKGMRIKGLDKVAGMKDVKVFHAGTAEMDGHVVTSGGRVLGVTALGDDVKSAIRRAYKAVSKISWKGMYYRKDIGKKALDREDDWSLGRTPEVGIIMGSPSDMDVMKAAAAVLRDFEVPCEIKVASAHRSPALAARYAAEAEERGLKMIIAGAGMAAHLAGAMAAHTHLPVIGVPVDSSSLKGMDALLATVQMPPGVPVATMAIGRAGAKNAAMFAVEILSLSDKELRGRLLEFRKRQAEAIEEKF
jgi:phosphoribosylamine--glycine ligase